jgi:hypothetical protein
MVTIEDLVGFQDGISRFYDKLGLGVNPILNEWAKQRDRLNEYYAQHRNKLSAKRKHSQNKVKQLKEGLQMNA